MNGSECYPVRAPASPPSHAADGHLLNPTSRSGYGGSRAGTRSRYRHGQSDRVVVWAHPAFANRHVVLRNDEEVIRVSLDEADYR